MKIKVFSGTPQEIKTQFQSWYAETYGANNVNDLIKFIKVVNGNLVVFYYTLV